MESITRRYDAVKPHLTERQRRVWLGAEARVAAANALRTRGALVEALDRLVDLDSRGIR